MIEENMEAELELGRLIRSARLEARMTQEDLARQAGLGTSTLRGIEAGRSGGPNVFAVLRILNVLGAKPDRLGPVAATLAGNRTPSQH